MHRSVCPTIRRHRGPGLRQQGLAERYDLSDALAIAACRNIFIRHCRPIFTNRHGLFLQTIYHPLRLYPEHAQDIALDASVDSPMYDLRPEQEAQPATTDSASRELCVAVVNGSPDEALPTTLFLNLLAGIRRAG
jgi:alpha-N-arabinofuranosidase